MKNLKNALLLRQLYQLKHLGYRYTSVSAYKEEEPDLTLPNTLETLEKQAQECHLCMLSKHRKKVVFGEGASTADLMIVGDTPSSVDDTLGKVFSDRSGEVLTKMIENVLGLTRKEVYITNILKCKALDSQTPSHTYAQTCKPYLLKQIELVQPKVILVFGELPYYYLSDDESPMTSIHGIAHKKDNYTILPTYHPSYLLRNPSIKKEIFEDLKKVKELLK